MITAQELQEAVYSYFLAPKRIRMYGKAYYAIIPKKARVTHTTQTGALLGYQEGKTVTEEGMRYSLGPTGGRTVFKAEPIMRDNEQYYLELKGYGQAGKELSPRHHSEGDLDYGIYHHHALREHELMMIATSLEQEGRRRSTKPVAVLQFSKKEFLRQAMRGLAESTGRSSSLKNNPQGLDDLSEDEQVRDKLYYYATIHGVEALVQRLNQTFTHPWERRHYEELPLIRKPAGYLIRATRSPFRISDAETMSKALPEAFSEENIQEAVRSAGSMYGALLDQGILHLAPHQQNMTMAGELTDYEDATRIEDQEAIQESWTFNHEYDKKHKEPTLPTLEDYFTELLGEHYLGQYQEAFYEGIRRGTTPRSIAQSIIEQHREKLGILIDKKLD